MVFEILLENQLIASWKIL